jgi:tryptophan-rich sensory protein
MSTNPLVSIPLDGNGSAPRAETAGSDAIVVTAPRTRSRAQKLLAAAAFAAPVVATAVVGSQFGPQDAATNRWYRGLEKPPFQPPAAVFAPVWTGLYATIAASGYRVWAAPAHPLRRPAIALWGAQLAANAAWSPSFFGARRPKVALAVLVAQLAATAAYAATAAKVDKPASALMAPYLAWTGFAGALNEEIVRRNPDG